MASKSFFFFFFNIYIFCYCCIPSLLGRVTGQNSTGKIAVMSSARTFQLVVCIHSGWWTCTILRPVLNRGPAVLILKIFGETKRTQSAAREVYELCVALCTSGSMHRMGLLSCEVKKILTIPAYWKWSQCPAQLFNKLWHNSLWVDKVLTYIKYLIFKWIQSDDNIFRNLLNIYRKLKLPCKSIAKQIRNN